MGTVGQVRGDDRRASIGPIRAIGSGLGIVVAGFLGVIVVPNWVLNLTAMSRDVRALLAASAAVGWVVFMALVLRRVQRRGLI